MTTEIFDQASKALADELEPTPADWLAMAEEYALLTEPAYFVTKDGEKLAPAELATRLKRCKDALKQHMERTGETYRVEGRGTLGCKPKRYGYTWALNDMYDAQPADFYHLLEERVLTVDNTAYEAAAKAGRMAGPEAKFRHEKLTSELRWQQ